MDEVVLLFDERSPLHHAEPGTEDSAQREPCFPAAFEEFLSCYVHISKAFTVIGLIWSQRA